MGEVPLPAGWVGTRRLPGQVWSAVLDPAEPSAARLVARVEFAPSTSLRRWREEIVTGLERSVEDWLLLDVGPATVAGERGFRVLGCAGPTGAPARVHETWCTVRDRHRCTVALTAGVRTYDDVIDAVTAAVRDWSPTIAEEA